MTSRIVVLVTAVGCVAAAGVGSYLAVRSTTPGSAFSTLAVPAASPITNVVTPARVSPEESGRTTETPSASVPTQTGSDNRPGTRLDGDPSVTVPVTGSTRVSDAASTATEPTSATEQAAAAAPASDTGRQSTEFPPTQPAPTYVSVGESFESLEVPTDAVLGIRIETLVSTETSKVEDLVSARLIRDVSVAGRVVIPAGTEIAGFVSLVERGGRLRERARLGVKFTTVVMNDRVRIPIQTDPVFRDGDAPAPEATAKIGASAVIGGIIGGMFGGKRGAAIGSAAGAAGGTAVVVTGGRNDATLAAGTTLTVRVSAPVAVQVERH